jgi:hypothetical protein
MTETASRQRKKYLSRLENMLNINQKISQKEN